MEELRFVLVALFALTVLYLSFKVKKEKIDNLAKFLAN